MPADTKQQDSNEALESSESFAKFVKRLGDRADKFDKFLLESEDDVWQSSSRAEPVIQTSKSMENFEVKKLRFLKEIDDEEPSDMQIFEQYVAENILAQPDASEMDRHSSASLLPMILDEIDPLEYNIDDFGAATAKMEQLANHDLAVLIQDQEKQDKKWSLIKDDSSFRPMSARLENVSTESKLFYERHSQPALAQEDQVGEDLLRTSGSLEAVLQEIDQEANFLNSELQKLTMLTAFRKKTAATTIQAFFRGYRIRRKYGTKLKLLVSEAKKRLFDDRVRKIEAERQRLHELKLAEELQRKAKLEEERKANEMEARRKDEQRKAEEERIRFAKEEEERRVREQQLLAERIRRESEEKAKLAELEVERARQERLAIELEERRKQEVAAEMAKMEELRLKKEQEYKAEEERQRLEEIKHEHIGERVLESSDKAMHFPQPVKSEVQASFGSKADRSTIVSTEITSLVRKSSERPRSRKEEKRRQADEAYERAKASFEDNQRLSMQEEPKPVAILPKRNESPEINLRKASLLSSQESKPNQVAVAAPEEKEVRKSVKRKSDRKPRPQVDVRQLKTSQMSWVKSCRPWSETVAQLKVSSGRSFRQTANLKSNVRPPTDCKAVSCSDLLSRQFGRSPPAPPTITSLTLTNLQSQFDLGCLSALTNLTCLDISYSNFTYLCNLDSCPRLAYLNVSHNKIKDLDLNKMSENLLFVDLSYNELTSLTGISNCTNLMSLNASYNRLVRLNLTLPPNIFFTQLHSLDMSHNQLLSSRDWMASMPSLICLDVSSNNLRNIDYLTCLGLLQVLNASYNSLSEVPDLSNCPLLIDVDLSGNNLHALDPLSTYFLPHLTRLNVSRNMLTSVPDISNLFNLIEARFEHNQIITYDSLMKISGFQKLVNLKFIRADFLCFSSDDAARVTDELRSRRGIELISADYDDAIALCSTLKLLISPGLLEEDESDEQESDTPQKEFLEFARFVILLQDNVTVQLSTLTDESNNNKLDKRKPVFPALLDNKWRLLKVYFEESSKGALERRYAMEFCGIDSSSGNPEAKAPALLNSDIKISSPVTTAPSVAAATQKQGSEPLKNIEVKTRTATVTSQIADKMKRQKEKEAEVARIKKRERAAIRIQAGWRGFLARYEVARWHVAATMIQKTWRGYWVRRQIKAVYEQIIAANSTATGNNQTDDDFESDIANKSVDDLLSFLSNIQSTAESINLISSRPGSRMFDKDAHKVAWTTPTPSARAVKPSGYGFEEGMNPADSPAPSSFTGSIPPMSLTSSKKVQHIQEEWGFSDPNTVKLMMKRAGRMKQAEKKQKLAKLDANQRLALARKQTVLESHHASSTHDRHSAETAREQYPTHEIRMGATIIATGRSNSPTEVNSPSATSRQNQTFAWLHSVIREPSPMPALSNVAAATAGFPPITPGGFMSNYATLGAASNRSTNSEQRRNSGNTTFPPINPLLSPKPTSASSAQKAPHVLQTGPMPVPVAGDQPPKKRDLIRAWREPAVRLSGGWGVGRAAHKKK